MLRTLLELPGKNNSGSQIDEMDQPGIIFPGYVTEFERELVRLVLPHTMVDAPRILATIYAVRTIVRHRIDGAIVECGVWRGGVMMAIAETLAQRGECNSELYLYDTFAGMPKPTEPDSRDGHAAIYKFRQLRSLKNRILLDHYYLPGHLEEQVRKFVDYYNHEWYHKSLNNLPRRMSIVVADRRFSNAEKRSRQTH